MTAKAELTIHQCECDALGRTVPYGLYAQQHNRGTVCVGQSADTLTFAVDNIAHWCQTERVGYFPDATRLMIEADCGGSNSYRSRVWKRDLQEKVADQFGRPLTRTLVVRMALMGIGVLALSGVELGPRLFDQGL
jgi:hypothetical protein